jgi:hypothetical protein
MATFNCILFCYALNCFIVERIGLASFGIIHVRLKVMGADLNC